MRPHAPLDGDLLRPCLNRFSPKRSAKKAARIDLTPMADLGLLLTTFFLFANLLLKPLTLTINMPADQEDITGCRSFENSPVLTFLLAENHRVYYYDGLTSELSGLQVASFKPGPAHVRAVILAKQKRIEALQSEGTLSPRTQLNVYIKPGKSCTYGDFVNLVDEMKINNIKSYAVLDPTPGEKALLPDN